MNRQDIVAAVELYIEEANRIFPLAKLTMPTVGFFDKGGRAGTAYCTRNHLEFNTTLAVENPDTFIETIIHEIAHLVIGTCRVFRNVKQAHGPQFKYVDSMLGGRGERCHSYDVSSVKRKNKKIRYEVVCACAGKSHWVTKRIATSVTAYCKICQKSVKVTGKKKVYV